MNKSLGFRDVQVFFDDIAKIEDGEPDHTIGVWYPTHNIREYMAEVWPWLSYEYAAEEPERSGYEEVEAHKIQVELNDIGKAFLTLEDYYANGAEIVEPPQEPEPEMGFDADAEDYYRWMAEEEENEKEGKDNPTDDIGPSF